MARTPEEHRKHRVRKRRLQVVAVLVGWVVASIAWSAWSMDRSNGASDALGPAPSQSRPVDTSPFKLARPDTHGPTTIPGDLGVGSDGGPSGTSTPTTVPAPSATLPPEAATPSAGPECDAVFQLYTLYRESADLSDDPAALAAVAATRLKAAAALLEGTGVPDYRAEAALLRAGATKVEGVTELDLIGTVLEPLLLASTPQVQAAAAPLQAYALANCPELSTVHGE